MCVVTIPRFILLQLLNMFLSGKTCFCFSKLDSCFVTKVSRHWDSLDLEEVVTEHLVSNCF